MRVLELFLISESLYEPMVEIGPRQGSLSGLK